MRTKKDTMRSVEKVRLGAKYVKKKEKKETSSFLDGS